jgi:putative membrane protein
MIDWRHWHNEPFLVGGLVVVAWLYAIFTGPLRPWFGPGLPYPAREARRFFIALLLFYFAVGSPLDQAGERFLFTAHMVQHHIMIYPAALLFLLGLPGWLVAPVAGHAALVRIGHFLTRPLICGTIFALTYSVWHVPVLYDWALQDKTVHIIEHLLIFTAGLFLWWPFASPAAAWPAAGKGAQMLYIFFVTVAMTPAFAFIVFSNSVLYPTYEFAPRITTLTPMDDQVLGGALMKIGGMAVALTAFAWSFLSWSREEQRTRNRIVPAGG